LTDDVVRELERDQRRLPGSVTEAERFNRGLIKLRRILSNLKKTLSEFGLPEPTEEEEQHNNPLLVEHLNLRAALDAGTKSQRFKVSMLINALSTTPSSLPSTTAHLGFTTLMVLEARASHSPIPPF